MNIFALDLLIFKLAGKNLIHYNSLFSPYYFEKNGNIILSYSRMSAATNMDSNLSDQTNFSLSEIDKIKDYFNGEIQERKRKGKKLSKYIDTFDYFDKTLIVLSVTRGEVPIIIFASIMELLQD